MAPSTTDSDDDVAPLPGRARPPRCSASRSTRSAAGRRTVGSGSRARPAGSASSPIDEVSRLLGERRRDATDRPIVAQSARNRFPGIVTRIVKDTVAAVVEIQAGPHRMVSLMTAEAIDDMDLQASAMRRSAS